MSFGRARANTEESLLYSKSPIGVDEEIGGLSGFGCEETYEPRRQMKRNMSLEMKRAVEGLEYSEMELEMLAQDSRQFNVLKKSLRNKGAVTNEVLKQKLPLFLKYKNDRLAQTNPEAAKAIRNCPPRSFSGGRLTSVSQAERMSGFKPVNRVLSDQEKYEAGGATKLEQASNLVFGRIMRPGARSGVRQVPARTKSTGSTLVGSRQIPTRTKSAKL